MDYFYMIFEVVTMQLAWLHPTNRHCILDFCFHAFFFVCVCSRLWWYCCWYLDLNSIGIQPFTWSLALDQPPIMCSFWMPLAWGRALISSPWLWVVVFLPSRAAAACHWGRPWMRRGVCIYVYQCLAVQVLLGQFISMKCIGFVRLGTWNDETPTVRTVCQ